MAPTPIPADWPGAVCLSPHVVDVVSCRLDLTLAEVDDLRGLLSPEERVRAQRFRSDRARESFVVARARARQLLGALCGRPPAAVPIAVGERGKPRLEGGGERLRFNVAHTEDLVVCAFTLDHELGVDVERVRDAMDVEALAERFFAAEETRSLAVLPPSARRDAFFACWTRKEAIIKATGEGLARALDSFVVSVDLDRAELRSADAALGAPAEWSLLPIPLPPGYQGAVAIRAAAVSLRSWRWSAAPPLGSPSA